MTAPPGVIAALDSDVASPMLGLLAVLLLLVHLWMYLSKSRETAARLAHLEAAVFPPLPGADTDVNTPVDGGESGPGEAVGS